MKMYIIYDESGEEVGLIDANSHNEAERNAKVAYGEKATVVYAEV